MIPREMNITLHRDAIIVLVGFSVFMLALYWVPISEAAIPPTRAFSKILIGNTQLNATSYDSILKLVTQGSITSSVSGNDTINVRLIQKACSPGQYFNAVGANGTLLCG